MAAPLPDRQTLYRVVGRERRNDGLGRRHVWVYRRLQDADGRIATLVATGGRVERYDQGDIAWTPMGGWET